MKAILTAPDGRLEWSEVPEPVAKDNELLIDIHAAGCNRADLLQRAGKYPPPAGWPEWMGLECAGVVKHSNSPRFKVGDRVCALLGGGGYAERVAVDAGMVLPIPGQLDFIEAAGIPEVFATAYLNLVIEAGIRSGDTVLIVAGASGLGSAAIQIAKHFGAMVITTVSSDEKAQAVSSLGADIAVNRKTENLAEALDRYPPDIALDCAAGKSFFSNIQRMNTGGRYIIVSTLAGEESNINLRTVMKKGLRIIGSTLRSRTPETKQRVLRELCSELWGAFGSGEIKPVIYRALPITDAEEAHRLLDSSHIGKVILTV